MVTVEPRAFCASIVDDPDYQARLRKRALSGQLAPALEAMLWHDAKGKPAEHVEVATGPSLVERLNAARRPIAAYQTDTSQGTKPFGPD